MPSTDCSAWSVAGGTLSSAGGSSAVSAVRISSSAVTAAGVSESVTDVGTGSGVGGCGSADGSAAAFLVARLRGVLGVPSPVALVARLRAVFLAGGAVSAPAWSAAG
ncbi:hypothetical protein [Microlunatus aurantiacus]|uniref:hypothetical protein n=1 Tax=Microlunatus aurantiacus TaxID=446786 RepID=UPI003CD0BAE5